MSNKYNNAKPLGNNQLRGKTAKFSSVLAFFNIPPKEIEDLG